MRMILPFLLALFSTGTLVTALHMILMCHFSPNWLHRINMLPNEYSASRQRVILSWLYYLSAVIGFATLGYSGTDAALWWMPYVSMFRENDGGLSLRTVVASGVAIWLGFHLPILLMGYAKSQVDQT